MSDLGSLKTMVGVAKAFVKADPTSGGECRRGVTGAKVPEGQVDLGCSLWHGCVKDRGSVGPRVGLICPSVGLPDFDICLLWGLGLFTQGRRFGDRWGHVGDRRGLKPRGWALNVPQEERGRSWQVRGQPGQWQR